ncbi:MAG: phosphomannomutase/phosphoglucomutase [Bacilli bacterium]|nr:phosphomannomutase/phosphoglucomutase [Bacilli bacterium]
MELKKEIFREYDIRGVYGQELDEGTAYLIGKAYGTKLRELNKKETVVAYDNRLSSPILEENLVKGLLETGIDVLRMGLATTPMCYFAANYYGTNASMMITASHNPKEYNGFKFSYNGIHNAYGAAVKEIYEIITKGEFATGEGTVKEVDITKPYIDLILNKIELGDRPIKVVYDCGNGTTSVIADQIFANLNVESIPLFNVSDGTFPNHHPDPCVYDNLTKLKEKVLEVNADLGIGYDGDGDRVGFIDNNGNMIETDKFMIIMWRYLYNKVENKKALFDVKCTKALEDELLKLGITPIEYRTGNSYTRAATAEHETPLGGELSGHVYFRDKFPGYDDGIYAGMRLIELLSHTDKPLSSMLDGINKYYSTEELKIRVEDKIKFEVIEKMKQYCLSKKYNFLTIDGVKAKFDDGFALVRASNTGPNITMRFEATTEERLKELQDKFTAELHRCIEETK